MFYPSKLHCGLLENCPVLCRKAHTKSMNVQFFQQQCFFFFFFILGLIFPFTEMYSEEETNWNKQGAELQRKPNEKRGARLWKSLKDEALQHSSTVSIRGSELLQEWWGGEGEKTLIQTKASVNSSQSLEELVMKFFQWVSYLNSLMTWKQSG